MELLSRLRDNTIIFTLKQNIEKYLKNSLSPDQVQLREFRLTLHDLDFNAEKINQHISANGDCGISLRSCTVGRMEIDVAELLFDIAGVEVVVGAQANSDPRRPGAEQNAAPASRPVEIGDVNPANPYATSTGHVTALAICLVELSGLLSSYLRIVITDLRASLHFTVPYAVDAENPAISVDITIPKLHFRDRTSEHYNNSLSPISEPSWQRKIVEMNSFKISLDGRRVAYSSHPLSVGIDTKGSASRRQARIVAQVEDTFIEMCSDRAAACFAIYEFVAMMRSEDDPSYGGVPAYYTKCTQFEDPTGLSTDPGGAQTQDNETTLMFLKDIPNLSSDDIQRGRLFQLYRDKLYSLASEREGGGTINGCDRWADDDDHHLFFDCSDATPFDEIVNSDDLYSAPSWLLEVELDFTNRLTIAFSNPPSMDLVTLQLADTTVHFDTHVDLLEVGTDPNAVSREGSAIHVTIKSLELSSEDGDDAYAPILASCTGAPTQECPNYGRPSFEVSLGRNGNGADNQVSVECALTRLNVNLDMARTSTWIRMLQGVGMTGNKDATLSTALIVRFSATSCSALLPLSEAPQLSVQSSDPRWERVRYPCLRHASPASLILELSHLNASLSSNIEGANEPGVYFTASAAVSNLHLIPDQLNPLRALKLVTVKGANVITQAAEAAASFRMRFRDGLNIGDSTSSVRSWELEESSGSNASLCPSMLEAKLIPSPTKGVLVSVASILITISTGEVAALLCQINEASATLCGLYHSPRPDVPQDMRLFSVFLEIQRIHGTLFRQSVPCARLGIVELFGVIECAEKDVCICAKDLEILSANAQLAWKPFVGRAPQVQSKPLAFMEHSMLTVRVDPRSVRVRLINLIIRHGNHGLLVDELRDASFLNCSEDYATQSSCRTIDITAEDFHVELFGSVPSIDTCERTVLEFTRLVMNTTMLVPVPVTRQAMLSTDHVRLLLAERSGPYSTLTEHNFVQVALLPGERSIGIRFTADADRPCVSAIVDVAELSVSFCADSLETLLRLLGTLNEKDDGGSDAMSAERDARRQTAKRSGCCRGDCSPMLRRDSPHDCKNGAPTISPCQDDFARRDNLSAFPSAEDFFLPSAARDCIDSEQEPGDSASKSAINEGCTERSRRNPAVCATNRNDEDEKEHGDEEWIFDGFFDTTSSTELEGLSRSDPAVSGLNWKTDIRDDDEACWAGWYGDAIGPGGDPALKVHHVPVPVKPACLRSVLKAPGSDIQISIRKVLIRMFGGLDWAPLNSVPAHGTNTGNHPSATLLASPLKLPAGMSASIHPDYFDGTLGALPLRRALGDELDGALVRPIGKRNGGGSNSGNGTDQVASVKMGINSAISKASHTRDTDAVTEISVLSAKLRRADTKCAFFDGGTRPCKFQPRLGHPEKDLLNGHVNLALDFKVSHSMLGKSKNCLYEWHAAGQAHEELDQYGQPVKMLSLEIFDVCSVDGAPKGHQVDIRLRPLRCCANWDLIDFLQSFCGNIGTFSKGVEIQAPGVRKVDLKRSGLVVQRGDVHALSLKIDLDTRLVELGAIQRGEVRELLKLFPLEGVELQLQSVRCHGVEGSLFFCEVLQSWVRDITSSQLHKFLAGTGPMRPLSTVGYNAANVVLLPLQEYHEGGRVLHGLKKGAAEFVKSLTLESIHASSKISRRIAASLDCLAERAPSSELRTQPTNLRSGLKQAQESLSAGINTAAQAIIAIPLEGPVKGAIRAVPIAFLAPVIGAAEAASYTLLGMRNAISPDRRHDEERQYNV